MFVKQNSWLLLLAACLSCLMCATSFQSPSYVSHKATIPSLGRISQWSTKLFEEKIDGVVELSDEEEETTTPKQAVAPFMSQGEIAKEEMDLSDPKQARVMFYIILSLLPVLFLIPLMLGSRDLIPPEMLPPVELN